MRNLKKILALVLALVMSFSLVSVAGAEFKDADKITEKYSQAVGVLSTLGVFNGRTETEFDPQGSITRAEVAAIIYRVVTGDVNSKQVGIYADYNKFDDVNSAAWYAGYVNFCANAEYIKGVGNNKFDPNGKVTGYQALAMILRAVGYDKNGEFTGANWQVQTASVAKELDITDTVDDITLGTAATREVVAELLFRTIAFVPQVDWTLLGGYNDHDSLFLGQLNPTLGEETFRLTHGGTYYDSWGRPYDAWFCDDVYENNVWDQYYEVVHKQYYEALVTYTEAVTECDIVKDLGAEFSVDCLTINGNATWVADDISAEFNGNTWVEKNVTKGYVGEQGRLTEIYVDADNYVFVVMIDEFLAKVNGTSEVTYDKNGHIDQYAKLYTTVYTDHNVPQQVVFESEENWTYAEGDFVLVNAQTRNADANLYTRYDYLDTYEVVGVADSINAKQTALTNKDSHFVGGNEYADAYRFGLDVAVYNTTNEYTWFFDSYGNVIGNTDLVIDYNYATITAIKWVDSNADLEDGYALATLTYMDGTQETVKVASIKFVGDAKATALTGVEGKLADYEDGLVSSTKQYNTDVFTNVALYRVEENAKGAKVLTETIDLSGQKVVITTGVPALTKAVNAGNTTKFLFWYDDEYTTATGIKNIPTYVDGSADYYWYVDVNGDNHAEYVFVSNPGVAADKATTSYHTFYAHEGTKLQITTHLAKDDKYIYQVDGAYVDGTIGTVKFDAKTGYANMNTLLGDLGNMYIVGVNSLTGLVTSIAEVDTAGSANYKYAVYAMKAMDAKLIDGVLTADIKTVVDGAEVVTDCSYDVDGATVISYSGLDLYNAVNFDNDAYLYVVYSVVGANEKVASYVYVTDEAGAINSTTTTPDSEIKAALKAAEDAIDAAMDAIDAAEALLGISLAAEEEEDAHEASFVAIEATIEGLTDAIDALEDIQNDADVELTEDEATAIAAMIVKLNKAVKTVKAALIDVAIDAAETAIAMVEALDEDSTNAEITAANDKKAVANTLLNTEITTYVSELDDNENTVSEKVADVADDLSDATIDSGILNAVLTDAQEAALDAMKEAFWAAVKADENYSADFDLVKADVLTANDTFIQNKAGATALDDMDKINAFNEDLADEDSELVAAIEAEAASYLETYITTNYSATVTVTGTVKLTDEEKTALVTNAKVSTLEALSFTVEVAAGKKVTSVTYKIGTAEPVTLTAKDGVYTIPASALKDVDALTITVADADLPVTVAVKDAEDNAAASTVKVNGVAIGTKIDNTADLSFTVEAAAGKKVTKVQYKIGSGELVELTAKDGVYTIEKAKLTDALTIVLTEAALPVVTISGDAMVDGVFVQTYTMADGVTSLTIKVAEGSKVTTNVATVIAALVSGSTADGYTTWTITGITENVTITVA